MKASSYNVTADFGYVTPVMITKIKHPFQIVFKGLRTEASSVDGVWQRHGWPALVGDYPFDTASGLFMDEDGIHNGMENILWADCHVSATRPLVFRTDTQRYYFFYDK